MDFSFNITLYSNPDCLFSQSLKYLLQYKNIEITLKEHLPRKLKEITLPALIHDDLLVYERLPLLEYINERFPAELTFPQSPPNKAIHRMIIHQIINNWYPDLSQSVQNFNDSVEGLKNTRFFLGSHIGTIDCLLYPILKEAQDFPQLHPRYKYYLRDLRHYLDK